VPFKYYMTCGGETSFWCLNGTFNHHKDFTYTTLHYKCLYKLLQDILQYTSTYGFDRIIELWQIGLVVTQAGWVSIVKLYHRCLHIWLLCKIDHLPTVIWHGTVTTDTLCHSLLMFRPKNKMLLLRKKKLGGFYFFLQNPKNAWFWKKICASRRRHAKERGLHA